MKMKAPVASLVRGLRQPISHCGMLATQLVASAAVLFSVGLAMAADSTEADLGERQPSPSNSKAVVQMQPTSVAKEKIRTRPSRSSIALPRKIYSVKPLRYDDRGSPILPPSVKESEVETGIEGLAGNAKGGVVVTISHLDKSKILVHLRENKKTIIARQYDDAPDGNGILGEQVRQASINADGHIACLIECQDTRKTNESQLLAVWDGTRLRAVKRSGEQIGSLSVGSVQFEMARMCDSGRIVLISSANGRRFVSIADPPEYVPYTLDRQFGRYDQLHVFGDQVLITPNFREPPLLLANEESGKAIGFSEISLAGLDADVKQFVQIGKLVKGNSAGKAVLTAKVELEDGSKPTFLLSVNCIGGKVNVVARTGLREPDGRIIRDFEFPLISESGSIGCVVTSSTRQMPNQHIKAIWLWIGDKREESAVIELPEIEHATFAEGDVPFILQSAPNRASQALVSYANLNSPKLKASWDRATAVFPFLVAETRAGNAPARSGFDIWSLESAEPDLKDSAPNNAAGKVVPTGPVKPTVTSTKSQQVHGRFIVAQGATVGPSLNASGQVDASTRGLANVVVLLFPNIGSHKGGAANAITGTGQVKIALDKRGVSPRIVVLKRGQTVLVENNDVKGQRFECKLLSQEANSRSWGVNLGLGAGDSVELHLAKVGGAIAPILGAAPGALDGFLFAPTTPYFAISDDKGNFAIDNVPPGTWYGRVWHPVEHVGSFASDKRSITGQAAKLPKGETPWIVDGNFKLTVKAGGQELGDVKIASPKFGK